MVALSPVVIFSPSSSSVGVLGCPVVINFGLSWRRSEDLKGHVLDCQNRDIIINRQFLLTSQTIYIHVNSSS